MPAFPYESCFQRVDQLVRPFHGSEPRANKPDDKRLIACLRSGRRILEDCTVEILLIELGEILDAAVERVDGTNLLRIRGDRQRVSLRGLEVHGAGQGVAVDDERQAPSSEHVGAVQETEVQVGTERRAGVPDLGQGGADLY